MKKTLGTAVVGMLLVSGLAFAEKVEDKKDLRAAHKNIEQAQKEITRAQAANEFDMGGHAAKAKDLLDQAEKEIKMARETVRADQTPGK